MTYMELLWEIQAVYLWTMSWNEFLHSNEILYVIHINTSYD